MTQTETAFHVVNRCADFFNVPASDIVMQARGPAVVSTARRAAAWVLFHQHRFPQSLAAFHLGRRKPSAVKVMIAAGRRCPEFLAQIEPLMNPNNQSYGHLIQTTAHPPISGRQARNHPPEGR